MKLNKYILSIALVIWVTLPLIAQDEVVLKMELKPELVYTGKTKNIMSSSMDFEGNDDMRQQIISSGTALPMVIEGVQQMSYKMTSDKIDEAGHVPFEAQYYDVHNTQSLNGAEQPQQPNPLEGMKSYGRSVPGESIEIDSINGENITPEVEIMARAMVKVIFESYNFPKDKGLKVGDTLVQNVPMKLPLGGYAQMDLKLIMTYKLLKIENEVAFFDIDHELELNADVKEVNMKATGGGKGNMTYSLEHEYTTQYNSDIKMELFAKMESFDLVGTMNMTTNQTVAIAKR